MSALLYILCTYQKNVKLNFALMIDISEEIHYTNIDEVLSWLK